MRSKLTKRRTRKFNKKDFYGYILIFIVTVLIIGIFILNKYIESTNIELKKNYCPENGAQSITAILIDRTDPFNTIQKLSIKNELNEIRKSINKYEKLEVYTLDQSSKKIIKPSVSICNPGNGENVNELIGNPRLARKKWKKVFIEPLNKTLNQALANNESRRSPIMEAIQAISVSSLHNFIDSNKNISLVIVSDMLQNSKILSHYKGVIDFNRFKNNKYCKISSNLTNVEVSILYIRRDDAQKLQGRKHILFWEKFFHNQGGILKRVVSVDG